MKASPSPSLSGRLPWTTGHTKLEFLIFHEQEFIYYQAWFSVEIDSISY
jgi:hypothetical protein